MRLIDVDNLIDDCKRYLATLNPDRDGKECTRIHWLIGVLNNAPSVSPDTPTNTPDIPTDCISRQVAVEAVHKNYDKILDFKSDGKTIASSVEDIICDLPSAQPEPQWIPVSERLPDMWDERYLVSLAWGGIGVMEYKSTGFHNYGSFTPVPIESITAWMPLPEPYRAERRTDG